MGLISRLGRWLDTRFPEKISAEDALKSLGAYAKLDAKVFAIEKHLESLGPDINKALDSLSKDVNELKDEMNKAKAVISMMTKMRQTPVMSSSEPWKR